MKFYFVLLFLLVGCGDGGLNTATPTPNPRPPEVINTGGCMGAQSLMVSYAGAAPPLVVDGADFDGTNDYMSRASDLTGNADSKTGIVSFWYRSDGWDGVSARTILSNNNPMSGGFRVLHNNAGREIAITGNTSAPTAALSIKTSQILDDGVWRHYLASWNLATTTAHLYVNDVSDLTTTTLVDATIKYTQSTFDVGALFLNGCLAEVYFAPGQYLDFSVESNRRKFRTALGKPANMGTTGATPTGTAPIIYLHLDDAEAVANFATNRGTGGDFTITGALATASTSPSD